MATWIDFKQLRSQLRFIDVLHHYKVQVKIKGDQATGFCPLPGHQSKREGRRRSPSFSVHLTKGIFQCFSCGSKGRGNIIDFALLMDGLNPQDTQHVRQTAIKLQELFLGSAPPADHQRPRSTPRAVQERPQANPKVIVNAPLDFELKNLDPLHPYLRDRDFLPETIHYFGLGFCQKGMMTGRVAIPLHDPHGKLIGYAGRLVDDDAIDGENPKYRFPGTRERDGVRYEFHKSAFLYNGHRIITPARYLTIVEGFPSVWWLFQDGYTNTVGLMGSDCAPDQGALIVRMTEPEALITILTDGDDAGIRCAHSIFAEVAPHRMIRWAKLRTGHQPTHLSSNELKALSLKGTE